MNKYLRRINEHKNTKSEKENINTTQYDKWGTWSDRIGVLVNIIMAAITLLLFSQAIRQNKISEKNIALADSSARAARLSAIAAQKTVDYADSSFKLAKESIASSDSDFIKTLVLTKKSVEASIKSASLADSSFYLNKQAIILATRNFEIDNRAIVYFDKIDIAPIEINKPIQTQISFQNFGKSPAFFISIREKISYDTSIDFKNFSYTKDEKKYVNLLVTQNKILSIPLKSDSPVDSVLYKLINLGFIKVFIHGELFFEDLASGRRMAYSFCMKMNPNRTFEIIKRHNSIMEITDPRDLNLLY